MQTDSYHRNIHGHAKWVLLIALALGIAASLLLWKVNQPEPSSVDSTATVSGSDTQSRDANGQSFAMPQRKETPDVVRTPPDATEEGRTDMEEIKAKQDVAAKAAIDAQPIKGTISQRPEFVSEIEWDVLKGAVAENQDVDSALSHFVNKLLFFKKRDAWMDSSIPADTRQKLARELLEMIPVQVSERAIDQVFADKMTADLNTFLSSSVN